MKYAGEPSLLRPLSLGEIFDRAVTLYVRNFALFACIALVVVVPMAILQYFAGLQESANWAQILAQVQHPGKAPVAQQSGGEEAFAFGTIALAVVLGAFSMVAIARAIGALYRGERVEWGACYAVALRRTGAVALTLASEVLLFICLILTGGFAMGLVMVAAVFAVRASVPLGVAAFAALAAIVLLWLAGMLLSYLAFAFAFNAIGVEEVRFGTAIGQGFSRIFNRTEFLRALVICLALVAIYLGLTIVSVSLAAVLEMMKLHVLYVLVSALISLVTTAFIGILMAVYYFDVRVRREGLDVQAQIEELQPAVTTP